MHICFSGKLDNLFKQDNMMAAEVFLKTGDYKGCIYETSMWGSEMTNSHSFGTLGPCYMSSNFSQNKKVVTQVF